MASAVLAILILLVAIPSSTLAFMIYKVGDDDGWTNRLKGSGAVDAYTHWASDKPFNIGDMLVFVYEANHTVVQTGNHEAYEACNPNVDDAQVWSSPGLTTANVMLKAEGKTYFFCSAWDGAHCRGGMRFAVDVGHANGDAATALAPVPSAPFAPAPTTTGTTTGGGGGAGGGAAAAGGGGAAADARARAPGSSHAPASLTGGAASTVCALVVLALAAL